MKIYYHPWSIGIMNPTIGNKRDYLVNYFQHLKKFEVFVRMAESQAITKSNDLFNELKTLLNDNSTKRNELILKIIEILEIPFFGVTPEDPDNEIISMYLERLEQIESLFNSLPLTEKHRRVKTYLESIEVSVSGGNIEFIYFERPDEMLERISTKTSPTSEDNLSLENKNTPKFNRLHWLGSKDQFQLLLDSLQSKNWIVVPTEKDPLSKRVENYFTFPAKQKTDSLSNTSNPFEKIPPLDFQCKRDKTLDRIAWYGKSVDLAEVFHQLEIKGWIGDIHQPKKTGRAILNLFSISPQKDSSFLRTFSSILKDGREKLFNSISPLSNK